MKRKIASLVAAGLMFISGTVGAGIAEASSLPPGSSMGSSSITGALGANAPRGTVVNQGDEIRMNLVVTQGRCTLGYVDRRAGIAYVAAHCGIAGQPVYNTRGQIIGYFDASNFITQTLSTPFYSVASVSPALSNALFSGASKDIATIRFVPGVVPGGNSFSGDRIMPLSQIRSGDTLCATGAVSRRISCGKVDRVRGETIFAYHGGLRHGDSGGPAWIPGKGFVGVNSGHIWSSRSGHRMTFAHPHR